MDYHLKSHTRTCAATGAELAPGTRCYSSLVERNGHFIRLDFSDDSWTGPPEGEVGHWQSVVPEADAAKTRPLDPDALMRYFEQLYEDAIPQQQKLVYVLSLLLLQKRRLKIEGSRQDGKIEYLQLGGSHAEGPFEVRDQQLSDEEIEQLQAGLNAHLASEWS